MAGDGQRRGVVMTSAELDGVSHRSDWAYWIAHGRAPASIDRGIDVDRWVDDFAVVRSLGAGEVVITPEWARLEPEPGHHDPIAVALVTDVIESARAEDLRVWLCLLDGTAPGWFTYDEHGFADRRARERLWPRHVEWVGETFGALVDGWIPIREPAHLAARSRWRDLAPPGGTNPVKGAEAVRDVALAEAAAWQILPRFGTRRDPPDGPSVRRRARQREGGSTGPGVGRPAPAALGAGAGRRSSRGRRLAGA